MKAVNKIKKDFPKLTESTDRPWVKKYKSGMKQRPLCLAPTIGVKRGRPTMLPEELDAKLCKTVLLSLKISGAVINSTTICGILMGLIRSDLLKYGQYLDFEVRSFVNSVYKRRNMTRRTSTTSRPAIPWAAWEEIRFQFLHKIAALVKEHNVPEALILNADQTPSKYAPTGTYYYGTE